ncbi:MAG: hypothetical protein IJ339_06985, partial [Oscillospiraceae bacterium]|nr:hypothetical protein [Oscillospiraceae bacterium]
MKILIAVLIVVLILVIVVLARTMAAKPTAALNAKVVLDTGERADDYGAKLAKMIQRETISHRGQTDRTKFFD